MKLVSFVIPCYRSAHTITGVTEELAAAMAGLAGCDYEIVLVNDCSPDNTWDVIRALAENDAHIVAVDLAKNFGQHAAIMAGLRHTAGEIVVCLDDDGQTPGDEAGKLIRKLEEGYDVVYAEYAHKQHSAFRNFGTMANNRMTEIMLGKPRELTITSYFAMRRFIVDEMLVYKNCYTHRAREEGESGYSLVKLFSLWMNGFTSFSVKPLRIATWCGGIAALSGFIYFIVILIKHFVDSSIPEGWTSTMALMLLLGGNEVARRSYEKAGFRTEGVFRDFVKLDGAFTVCGAAGDPEEGLSG